MRVWAAFCQVARDWPHPVMARTLRLTVQNRRLTSDCDALVSALALSNRTYEKQRSALAQAIHERDDAMQLAVDLRADLEALHVVNLALMQTAPSDARELGEAS